MDTQQTSVKSHFDSTAINWSKLYVHTDLQALPIQRRSRYAMEMVDRVLPEGRGRRALDLGCGSGEVSEELLHRNFSVHGVDIAPRMIELAKERCQGQATFECASVYDLEVEPKSFDLIIALGFIEYLPHDRWVLMRMARWLAPGGHLIVTIPNHRRLTHWVTIPIETLWLRCLRPILRPNAPPIQSGDPDYARNKYAPADLEDMVLETGCRIVRTHGHSFGPFKIGSRQLLPRSLQRSWYRLADALSRRKLVPRWERLGADFIVCAEKPSRRSSWKRVWKRIHEPKMSANGSRPWGRSPAELDLSRLGSRILVVAVHPDDEIIGAGGTLLQAARRGAQVTVVYVTNGCRSAGFLADTPPDRRRQIRVDEARAVCRAAGFDSALIGVDSHEDGIPKPEFVRDRLAEEIRRIRPTSIFCPSPTDNHPEHRDGFRILEEARSGASWSGPILRYEVWGFVQADLYCSVSDCFEDKAEILYRYVTGMRGYNYISHCFTLARFRASTLRRRADLVEAFRSTGFEGGS